MDAYELPQSTMPASHPAGVPVQVFPTWFCPNELLLEVYSVGALWPFQPSRRTMRMRVWE
jgi:hypothetical protein